MVVRPHLAARGSVYLNDWQRGRHIYNFWADSAPPPTIRTSGREFYKRANNDNPTAETLCGFGSSNSRFVVGAFRMKGRDYPLQPKRLPLFPMFSAPPDTLVTAWFTVGQSERVRLTSAGEAPEQTEVWLERRSDGSRWIVPFDAGERRRLARLFMRLENGNDEEYRLEILNAAAGAFRREIVLDADTDGLERGNGADDRLINLNTGDAGSLIIFPNPAAEEVHIAVRGEERAEVVVVNALGQIMWQTGATSGGVLTVRTADFAAGMYAVRVHRAGLPDEGGRFAVMR
jgi:hypothetical protein